MEPYMKPAHLLLILALSIFAGIAKASAFFEKEGVAIRGYDPVAYFTDGGPRKGSAEFTSIYKGSTFRFASASNRDAFAANPGKYAPQYDGYCAYGVTGGYKAATDPTAWKIVDGKLYLNYNKQVQDKWSGDIPGYLKVSEAKWPAVEKTTKVIE